jgi:hypothetical protein
LNFIRRKAKVIPPLNQFRIHRQDVGMQIPAQKIGNAGTQLSILFQIRVKVRGKIRKSQKWQRAEDKGRKKRFHVTGNRFRFQKLRNFLHYYQAGYEFSWDVKNSTPRLHFVPFLDQWEWVLQKMLAPAGCGELVAPPLQGFFSD